MDRNRHPTRKSPDNYAIESSRANAPAAISPPFSAFFMDHGRAGDRPLIPTDRPTHSSHSHHRSSSLLQPPSSLHPPTPTGPSHHHQPPRTMMSYASAPLHGSGHDHGYLGSNPPAHSHSHSPHMYGHGASYSPMSAPGPGPGPGPDYILRRSSDLPATTSYISSHASTAPVPSPQHPPPIYPTPTRTTPPMPYRRFDPLPPISYDLSPHAPGFSGPPSGAGPVGIVTQTRNGSPIIKHESHCHQSPFRFHTILETPTSMVQRDDEIPITYLNKSQKYRIIIADSNSNVAASLTPSPPVQYRTSIRVMFDDAGQRREPAAAWELWRETRDTRADDESRSCGSQLRALEYVDEGDRRRAFGTDVQLERQNFDGFTVIWTPAAFNNAQCAINLRFNFLSTDFSQTKGVKGVAVRVVAKTSIYNDPANPASDFSELSYCKAKVFRDHGAERKLAIDSDRVRRNIEKIRHSLRGSERSSGLGKRKDRINKRLRNVTRGRSVRQTVMDRVYEDDKYDIGEDDLGGDDDGYVSPTESLQIQLRNLEQMSRSINTCTVFILKGEDDDDPDLHPVQFFGDRSHGHGSDHPRHGSNSQWSDRGGMSADGPSRNGHKLKSESIDALDIDHSYRPPASAVPRAVACFYLRRQTNKTQPPLQLPPVRLTPEPTLFRATYLLQRTAENLRSRIGDKWNVDTSAARLVFVNPNRLQVIIDDEFVQRMPEGQAYDVELSGSSSPQLPPVTASGGPVSLPSILNMSSPKEKLDSIYEIRLTPTSA